MTAWMRSSAPLASAPPDKASVGFARVSTSASLSCKARHALRAAPIARGVEPDPNPYSDPYRNPEAGAAHRLAGQQARGLRG
ncbi:hypothetical protein G6F22_020399 [Rhizopus arrhizus]|nr:hypothetical protein G6F22_020399 [Rhizopus arrhizus]